MKKSMEQKLKHMLGADSRYKKKNWGFKNHYCASINSMDADELAEMEQLGFVKVGGMQDDSIFYHATKKGAMAIGFKPYQLASTTLAPA